VQKELEKSGNGNRDKSRTIAWKVEKIK